MEIQFHNLDTARRVFAGARTIVLSRGCEEKHQLLGVFADALGIGSYFGYNWDALEDALKSLHGIQEIEVAIIHQAFPVLHDAVDHGIYLDVLRSVVQHWASFPEHKVVLIFDPDMRDAVNREFMRGLSM